MKRYKVEMQREGSVKYFFIRDMETLEIVLLPSKYLMHQVRANRSPNTIRRNAFALALCNEILQKLHINGNVENFSFARNRTWIAVGMVLVCVGCLGISIKSSEHIMEKMEEF